MKIVLVENNVKWTEWYSLSDFNSRKVFLNIGYATALIGTELCSGDSLSTK
jgi:hypothetical protein